MMTRSTGSVRDSSARSAGSALFSSSHRAMTRCSRCSGNRTSNQPEKGNRVIDWDIAPERDSFFQIDDDLLVLTFGQDQKRRVAEIVQS